MYIVKWVGLFLAIFVGISKIALADALDSWPTWSVAQPYVSKQVPPNAMIMRGKGTDAYYVLEVDPATGAIPVTGDITVTIDYSGVPGSPVPSDAAYVAGTDGTNLRGLKTDTNGELQVDVLTVGPPSGRSYVTSVRNAYASTAVTTGAWVQLIADTGATVIGSITLFDSSGQTLELGTGAALSEARKLIIPPGGIDGPLDLGIPAHSRVSIKAISGTASVGEIDITAFN